MVESSATRPEKLQASALGLAIEWADGAHQRLSWRVLRDHCPCATCRAERTAAPAAPAEDALLPVITVAETQPLKATSINPVGNYAYGIRFSDGHDSGIFTLEQLRLLGDRFGGGGGD